MTIYKSKNVLAIKVKTEQQEQMTAKQNSSQHFNDESELKANEKPTQLVIKVLQKLYEAPAKSGQLLCSM